MGCLKIWCFFGKVFAGPSSVYRLSFGIKEQGSGLDLDEDQVELTMQSAWYCVDGDISYEEVIPWYKQENI